MAKYDQVSWEEAVVSLRNDPAQADLVKACFYDDPVLQAAKRYAASSEWRALAALLPIKKGVALDLGAGRGIVSYALSLDGWRVVAVEPDTSPIVGTGAIRSLASEAGLEIAVVESFGESLPLSDETFDLVHCRAVLHHAADLPRLCCEIARVLRPGGTLIATREHVLSSASDRQKFLESHALHRLYGGEDAFTLQTYIDAMTAAGLRIERKLNSYESDINLYPDAFEAIKRRVSSKIHASLPSVILSYILKWRGRIDQTPGRLYTFIARKP